MTVSEPLKPGTRVRHVGELYYEAMKNGTGTIVKALRHYPIDNTWEYLVECDKPPWGNKNGETLIQRNHVVPINTD